MRRVARLLLLWLIVAVVPLHGSAVAMALRGHSATAAAGQGALPMHVAMRTHAQVAMHMHMQMQMHAHAGTGTDMPAPMGDPATSRAQAGSQAPAVHHDACDSCNACSACCSPAALPDLPTLVAAETAVLARPAGLASPSPVFLTDGPERPPRGVLA